MQCLISTPNLRSQVSQAQSARNKEVTVEFLKFLSPIDRQNGSVSATLDPEPLLRAFCAKVTRFQGSEQHDSLALLRYFLDQLRQEEKASWANENETNKLTAVDKVFGGHTMTVYICMKCKTPHHLCEPFLDISVPICLGDSPGSEALKGQQTKESEPESATPYQEAIASIMERLSDRSVDLPSEIVSITDCLQYFTRQEKLGQQYLCNSCAYNPASAPLDLPEDHKLTVATKQTLIFNPPAVLVIHLKRFEMRRPEFQKRTNTIKFEELLDLAPYCSSSCLRNERREQNIWYSLYGVVVHSGSLNSGHYVAYVKERSDTRDVYKFLQKEYFDRDVTADQLVEIMQKLRQKETARNPSHCVASKDDNWYCMNDSRVTGVSVTDVLKQEAFLLFYERVSSI